MKSGKKEEGKIPSRSVRLHQEIYERHPEIESVIIAHPPNTMAFAVTEEQLDSRTIPEKLYTFKRCKKITICFIFYAANGNFKSNRFK